MRMIRLGNSVISEAGPCYVIAEIGHNHQGSLDQAVQMIEAAAKSGANAVKFQKRNNRSLFTAEMYGKSYDHENSFGKTYGEHRERLEFGEKEYTILKQEAEKNGVEFMCAPFDFDSVDFLERLGIASFKFASCDITNIPLLTYAAKLGKPMFMSTGAATLEEVGKAYEAVRQYTGQICLFHCVCEYPAEYENLNLNAITTLRKEFPEAVIGYSGHDNGILAACVAYLMGAVVVEKHFTLNHSWKGTDHAFSLEPEGLRKQVRDLRRIDLMMGNGQKRVHDYEMSARAKMGKSLYACRDLPAGHVLAEDDVAIKSPGGHLPPYYLEEIVGKKLASAMKAEQPFENESFSPALSPEKLHDRSLSV